MNLSTIEQIRKDLIPLELSLEYREPIIYHYTSPQGLLGILNSDGRTKLWFTQYDSLNDRSERSNTFTYIHRYCDSQLKENKLTSEFCDMVKNIHIEDVDYFTEKGEVPEQLKKEGIDEITNLYSAECDIYLCCFSAYDDLLAMWNYYSKSQHYEGYSAGVWSQNLKTDFENNFKVELRQVVYSDKTKNNLLNQLLIPLSQIYDNANEQERTKISQIIYDHFSIFQFIFKDQSFSHEQEIRAILKVPKKFRKTGIQTEDSPNNEKCYVSKRQFRISNGYVVPYVEFFCPQHSIASIKISPLLERELAEKNLYAILEQYEHENVRVQSSNIPIRF